ncbi:transglycosylase [uncultured Draconibacterium sp.]|uniref:transglycosylase n=1 Tax=uncultured Draconibacterium sp. TaxID=1573823 RepID=UPI0029BFDC5E|nr:transglycosylase [uncultured Draconibacterium sp.]
MKVLGIILLLIGLIGTILFGVQAMNNSEAFNFLGIDIAVSSANWTPVIISGILALIGVVILSVRKRKVA